MIKFLYLIYLIIVKNRGIIPCDEYNYRMKMDTRTANIVKGLMNDLCWRSCFYLDGDIGFDFDFSDYKRK